MSEPSIIKKIVFPLGIIAFLLLFGFISWDLRGHGAIGLMRVNPIFLYASILVFILGIVFTVFFLRYWSLYLKGQETTWLFNFCIVTSVIFIFLFSTAFAYTGFFPPSKDIQPVTQLAISDADIPNLHFAVGSDAHFGAGDNNPDKTMEMLNYIGNPANNFNLFFSLGDNVEYGFKDALWAEAVKAYSSIAEKVAVRFLPGNHDTMFGGLKRYLAYCAPLAGLTQSESRLWQRIDIGHAHFLLLDIEWSAETFNKEQKEWLEEQLQNIPADDWKIVMGHGFYYASGITLAGWNWYDNPETIAALTPLFEKYNVDMVFSGHNHNMELLRHSGVTYALCGAFGGVPDPAPTYISPESVWQKSGQTGYMDITLNGNEATLNFRSFDSSILQTFTVTKH